MLGAIVTANWLSLEKSILNRMAGLFSFEFASQSSPDYYFISFLYYFHLLPTGYVRDLPPV